jgi:SAM-dependent methyltransferase
MAATDYDNYVRTEWKLFLDDAARSQASLDAVSGLSVKRVLDIGCGAGQELLPFVAGSGTVGVGIDITPEVGLAGGELFALHKPKARVVFVRSAAERLPFQAGCFDVVVCRLALPYTNNAQTFAEVARVLRSGGVLLLKIHHARYYLRKLWRGLLSRQFLSALHAARVLIAGVTYTFSGRQPSSNLQIGETFQTEWMLRRELARQKLTISRELPDSNPATPSFLIIKER